MKTVRIKLLLALLLLVLFVGASHGAAAPGESPSEPQTYYCLWKWCVGVPGGRGCASPAAALR